MQRTVLVSAMVFTIAVLQGVLLAAAATKTYQMTGKITAIELASRTVVVEVPVGKGMFTVGGPLSAKAAVRKQGRTAQLQDFKVGDRVTVEWRAATEGHVIDRLEVR